jgi:hypothetical protein
VNCSTACFVVVGVEGNALYWVSELDIDVQLDEELEDDSLGGKGKGTA